MQTSVTAGRSIDDGRRHRQGKGGVTTAPERTAVLESADQAGLRDHVWRVLESATYRRSRLKRAIFRGFDLVGAVALLVLFSPILLVTAVLIKATSPGPVFYGSPRVARDGPLFRAWKFRSMVAEGDRVLQDFLDGNPEAKREYVERNKLFHDPRITAIGRVIRTSSIDELPQLWNVVRGDMSLVGPRPKLPNEVERYEDLFELVCSVRPGLTGLWQVSGRSALSFDDRIALDVQYVLRKSLLGDIAICLRTTKQMVHPSSEQAH